MSIRPTVISFFSGAGGSALGYRLGGFNELLGIDAWIFIVNVSTISILGKVQKTVCAPIIWALLTIIVSVRTVLLLIYP